MGLDPARRAMLIERYAAGPEVLQRAFEAVPVEARQWRPAPGEWSAHEIVLHCADSETNAAARIRYLLVEPEPRILGYDQERWATDFSYHVLPVEQAFATVEAVRAGTVQLLGQVPEEWFAREGTHSESGRYTVSDWLETYGAHLHDHAEQIAGNVAAWQAQREQ